MDGAGDPRNSGPVTTEPPARMTRRKRRFLKAVFGLTFGFFLSADDRRGSTTKDRQSAPKPASAEVEDAAREDRRPSPPRR